MPNLESILAAHPGARVIMALGTNDLTSTNDTPYKKVAQALRAHGDSCEWIGPPHVRPDQDNPAVFPYKNLVRSERSINQFYDMLSETIDPYGCHLVDSREATAPGTPGSNTHDGGHRYDSDPGRPVSDLESHILPDLENDGAAPATTTAATWAR